MLEYCWLFALLLRSARYFTGIEGKWTPFPPISLASEIYFLNSSAVASQPKSIVVLVLRKEIILCISEVNLRKQICGNIYHRNHHSL